MNIFFLSWTIQLCAQYHCDKHVIKMILEYTQLLSTAWFITDPDKAELLYKQDKIYKKTHINHLSSIWVRECKENYIWLCYLGLELCKEYAFRYDKSPEQHKTYNKLIFLSNNIPSLPDNNGYITIPKMCMPDIYKRDNPVLAYRLYYINEKNKLFTWKNRDKPKWIP